MTEEAMEVDYKTQKYLLKTMFRSILTDPTMHNLESGFLTGDHVYVSSHKEFWLGYELTFRDGTEYQGFGRIFSDLMEFEKQFDPNVPPPMRGLRTREEAAQVPEYYKKP